GSPCADAADNDQIPAGIDRDLAGRERFVNDPAAPDVGNGMGPLADMGALEFQADSNPGPIGGGRLLSSVEVDHFVALPAGDLR
ncbi:MAG: hypothetical protein V3T70_11110, partial [Phycisphaerae bacterium]